MIAVLVTHLWQSTLFAGVAGLFVLALRRNQARLRHLIWFTTSAKFLVPFYLLVGIGTLVPHPVAPAPRQGWVGAAEQIALPLIAIPTAAARVDATAGGPGWNYVEAAAGTLWACGFVAIALWWSLRWKRVHRLRRSATLISIPTRLDCAVPVMSTPGLVEPGIFGVLRPVLLLPDRIEERLDRTQLDAIIAHELCHVRRLDNLTAAIHMLVQAIFWFHPLVWWLGARQVDERERACDEEVLDLGFTPKAYAEAILNVCKLYVESPLACISGVTGANLKKRIEAIMSKRAALKLSFAGKAALATVGVAALLVPVIFGILNVPAIRAQAPQPAQPAAPATPKFEVAAIKLCDPNSIPGTRGGGPPTLTPRCLTVNCQPLEGIIFSAYLVYANGHRKVVPPTPTEGAPGWLASDRYLIEAKSESDASPEMMQGPMLQALLEERFQLKVHRATREAPVYELNAAKGGPKLKAFDKSCTPTEPGAISLTPREQKDAGYCRPTTRWSGSTYTVDAPGWSVEQFTRFFLNISRVADRPVIDKTGITGLFDFHLVFVTDPDRPRSPAALQEQIGDVLDKQLGLKLQTAKGPSDEFLVIDHIERHPSAN
jgi:bla regulator protein blaR1